MENEVIAPETAVSSATPVVTTIAEIGKHEGQSVTLRGWLYNLRSSGKLLFPTFRDGSGTIQGIVPKAAVPEVVFETLKNLTLESSLVVTGKVRADSRAPSGFELDVEDVSVTQRIADETPYPIQLKEAGVDFLMEHRHLWLRTPRQSAILRVRATIMRAAAEYFDTSGFIRTDPPILTPNACEGTSELFEMDYFDDDKAYLTQSGQLYIEATALALGKVYSFGPTFRAEKSKTRRHLTEFWMIEPEVCYMDLDGLMGLAEGFLTHIVARVLETHRAELKVIGKDIAKLEAIVAPGEFPRLSYDDAHQMLVDAHAKGLIEGPHTYGDDFGSPDETYISNQFDKPVMVRGCARAGRLWRDHRRIAARGLVRSLEVPHRSPRPAHGRLPVVPRSAQVRQRSSLRLWHGYRALRRLGVWPGARPRDDSIRSHTEPDLPVTAKQTKL
jgi:asparaginyl-tRNA synthetase